MASSQLNAKRKAGVELTDKGPARTGDRVIDFKKAKTNDNDTPSRNSPGRCISVGERYTKLGRIGEGTYGIVYKARDNKTQGIVALKRCLPHHEASDGFSLTTLREIASLKTLVHPSIVQMHHVAVSNKGVFLVFEFCQHDLAYLVDSHYMDHNKSPFSHAEVKQLLMQLLEGLNYMHRRHFIHRDIKLSNLLYSKGQLKLADFGLSRKLAYDRRVGQEREQESLQPLTGKVVSLWYRPPDILLGTTRYDKSIDNWGAGCVFGELLTGEPLLSGKNEADQLSRIYDLLGLPTEQEWPDLVRMPLIVDGTFSVPRGRRFEPGKSLLDRFQHLSASGLTLLKELLAYDSNKRCTASKALESAYFKETPLPAEKQRMPAFPPKPGAS